MKEKRELEYSCIKTAFKNGARTAKSENNE